LKFYRQFLAFLHAHWKGFVFFVIFWALWLVSTCIQKAEFDLVAFPGRMIGEATLNAYDINKRIHFFYECGFLFLGCMLFISLFFMWISSFFKAFFKSAEMQILNYTALAGICFYFFQLFTDSFGASVDFIWVLQGTAAWSFLMKKVFLKKNETASLFHVNTYSLLIILSISLSFLANEMFVLYGLGGKITLGASIFIFYSLFFTCILFYHRHQALSTSQIALDKFFVILLPLLALPFLSVLKDECYLIGMRHQIYFFSPRKLYFLLVFILWIGVMWRYYRHRIRSTHNPVNREKLLAKQYFPFFILSYTCYVFYQPFIDLSAEMFEAGNRILPLMEYAKFGVIPILEKFNSHLLSELFFGAIYSSLNGLHTREMYIYDFIYQVFWACMVYVFMYKITRNAFIAVFWVLFFPLTPMLLSDYSIISLLSIFAMDKVIHEKASYRNYIVLMLCMVFLFLWRIDIGYPSFIAVLGCLLVYLIHRESFKINWKILIKSKLILVFFAAFTIFILGWYRKISIFENIWNALNYLASAQSYGMVSYGEVSSSIFKMQYFVFPLLIILGFAILIVFFKRFNISRKQRFVYLSFVFLILYYFVNFQRGLVRHSFAEGHDEGLSSFAFFIFSGSVYLFFYQKNSVYKFILMMGISGFLLMNYKFPQIKNLDTVFGRSVKKIENFSAIALPKDMDRCLDTLHFEQKQVGDFKKLIENNLQPNQTFIDFANMPMLYYFTGKESPSYFYQNPLTIHNDYLQKQFLKQLKKYDAPFLVFSHFPRNWWDETDGVPNGIRHYRLAEYFYQNYAPFTIVNDLCIWKRNDLKILNRHEELFSFVMPSDSVYKGDRVRYHLNPLAGKKYLVQLHWKNQVPELKLEQASAKAYKADYYSDIDHLAYYVLQDIEKPVVVSFSGIQNISSLQIVQYDYLPDFYSSYPRTDDVKKLPFIWASFDTAFTHEKVVLSLISSPTTLTENAIQYFNFQPAIDKRSGTILSIGLSVDNSEDLAVDMMYGSSKNGFKGAFKFVIPSGKGLRNLALRLSTQKNWFDSDVDYVALVSKGKNTITLQKLILLKAESHEL